jgi:glycosyltransferase involved in cell wall biosynthesis
MSVAAATAPVRSTTAGRGGARSAPVPKLRLAYLTTVYPKVSHTFIRREILELERLGFEVLRLSIRNGGGELVEEVDHQERRRTVYCLDAPMVSLLGSLLATAARSPARLLQALSTTLRMARRSERGVLRHLAYLVEATHLLRIVRERKIDHVHVHFGTNPAAVARLMRRLGGPTYSITVHGPDEFDAPMGLSLAEKIAEATFVVAISDFGASQLRRWAAPEHWDRIHVIHCTVDQSFLENAPPVDADTRQLLCVGRLTAQKGQLTLLDAMALLACEGIEGRLVLAGDGELRELLEQRIDELKIRDRVEITGWVDGHRIRELLAGSKAMVLPSFAEGLPVVIMEALARRRPVISTTVAGIPELVEDGVCGWLVTPGRARDLADAMRAALEAPAEKLRAMGDAGQARVREMHCLATEASKLVKLLPSGPGAGVP